MFYFVLSRAWLSPGSVRCARDSRAHARRRGRSGHVRMTMRVESRFSKVLVYERLQADTKYAHCIVCISGIRP